MEATKEINKEYEVIDWYDLYSDSVFKYIALMIKDFHKSEDLTQETFIKAYLKYDELKKRDDPKVWLFSIARNLTIDYIRRNNRFHIILHFLLKPDKDTQMEPENIVLLKEDSMVLYNALCKLKPAYREVILLRRIKEFSTLETGQILGWSEGKVKNTLSRALKKLEGELKKEVSYHE